MSTNKSPKVRLDALLVERELAESRTQAKALVMAGAVFSGERRLDKPGVSVSEDLPLEVRERGHPWASRGGLKLDHALEEFALDVNGRISLDIGASTGGFTDVLLRRGAAKVYAVDVGRGQLAWKLRNDDRVVVLERTNARDLSRELVPEPIGVIVCDASFIGLRTVLPAALELAAGEADLVALIKPQFEVGTGKVGKGGVVRDAASHKEVCDRIRDWLNGLSGWTVTGLTESPVLGPKGNKEFLIAAHRGSG